MVEQVCQAKGQRKTNMVNRWQSPSVALPFMTSVRTPLPPRITQELLGPDSTPRLHELSCGEDQHLSDLPWHLVVHVPNEIPGVILHMAGDMEREEVFRRLPLFRHLVEAQLPLSFGDALYLTTVFPILPNAASPAYRPESPSKPLPPAIGALLQESRGFLLYAHQLEQLYSMTTGASASEARNFRRDWNLKHPRSRSLAAQVSLSKGYTLLDLIAECTLERAGFVYSAQFRGAYRLYNHLNRRIGNKDSL